MELRFNSIEVRLAGDGKTLKGYAAVFNKQSTDDSLGFREVCRKGMFARSIRSKADVRCLHNHRSELLLGRTKSGTLRCSEDSTGLDFECDLPNTSTGNDVRELCRRGDLSEMSFGFVAQEQDWEDGEDERSGRPCVVRNLLDVDLLDVSPVTYPAYGGTSVHVRSMFVGEVDATLVAECRQRGIAIPTLAEVVKVAEVSDAARRSEVAKQFNSRLL
jgi:HK97 family phage prohead protease